MATKSTKARVRYDDGKVSGKESYHLEIWDDYTQAWGEYIASRFVADAKNPDAGADFIHFRILVEAINLVNNGYEIDI